MTDSHGTAGAHQPSARDWVLTAVLVTALVLAVVVGGVLWGGVGAVIVALLVLPPLVWWHSRRFACRCPSCDTEFRISPVADLISISWFKGRQPAKQLRCPQCGQRSMMALLRPDGRAGPLLARQPGQWLAHLYNLRRG